MDDSEWEIRQRAAEALEGRDEVLADLARRQAAPRESGRLPDPPKPVRRAPEPARCRDWTAEQRWIEAIIDQRIAPALAGIRKEEAAGLGRLAEVIGGEVAKLLAAERAKAEARLAASENEAMQLIADLEQRLAALEQRAAAPMPRMLPRVA